ncbi:hypothetical protein N9Y42_03870 [Mariniblastus sp.]|nr:hypothetical protein [Mariniblastus sp.]
MLEKIRFQKNVPGDLENILNAYELISISGANKVRSEIQRTLELIASFPEMYATIEQEIRLVKTRNYPLLVQYVIVNDIPVVLSVYHSDLNDFKLKENDA